MPDPGKPPNVGISNYHAGTFLNLINAPKGLTFPKKVALQEVMQEGRIRPGYGSFVGCALVYAGRKVYDQIGRNKSILLTEDYKEWPWWQRC